MPLLSCCSRPEPCEVVRQADGRRERIDCIEEVSRNGTLDDVFGIEPPCTSYFIIIIIQSEFGCIIIMQAFWVIVFTRLI